MQSCGISAEFERNLFKLSKIHRISLSFMVSWSGVFKREQKNIAQPNIDVPKCRICQNNFKINVFCVEAVNCKMASGLRRHLN